MNETDSLEIIKEGLGGYPFTPVIAATIKFMLRNRYESLVIVNEKGEVEFIDGLSERYFNLVPGKSRGEDIKKILPFSELAEVAASGNPQIGRLFKIKDRHQIVSRFPLIRNDQVIGAFGRVLFHSPEELERVRKEAEQLKVEIRNAERKIRNEYQANYTFDHILGVSEKILEQKELAKRMAKTQGDILIQGESGTGKEIFCHAIHNESRQKSFPFIRVNCPAIPIEIAESELFGYERGAFTGAVREGKPGKFELAEGGTIFLDEVGALPLSIQAKLLRVIQEREIERIGGKKSIRLNFRLISATNIDLKKLAAEGKFRYDLFFRLSKAILTLPPLRERKDDIPIYVSHFVRILNKNFGAQVKNVSQDVLDILKDYDWPGNVREVGNVLEQSFYNMGPDDVLRRDHLPDELGKHGAVLGKPLNGISLGELVHEVEKETILKTLRHFSGNKRKTALHLGIPRSVLYLKLKKFALPESSPA